MLIQKAPDAIQKLALVGDSNRFEAVGDQPSTEKTPRKDGFRPCITHVSTPRGKKPVLKGMMTTACELNCNYCPFRAGRSKIRRVTFKPDELASTFDELQRARLVDGLFLSSGIVRGGVTTQDKIIDTVEIVRRKYAYKGYVHLKIMPGAEYDQIERAMRLADRVSVNLEGPTSERLNALAPRKDFSGDLLARLGWAHEIRRSKRLRASMVTQFVVGAVGDTDLELLSRSAHLYRQWKLSRVYYSRFNPLIQTPFEDLPSTPALREHRLYQASFLLRDYGWDVEDFPLVDAGNLKLDVDPKQAWADEHLRDTPLEVMQASRHDLLRVPGIGPKSARAILRARRKGRLEDVSHLRAIGIRAAERAAPYILLDGRRPPQQLSFIDKM